MTVNVRERPPLALAYSIKTPGGRYSRWGQDERDPANVPTTERFSDTMPGGFENLDLDLPRKSGQSYQDLDPLSTVRVEGAGGECAWEGRLERTPRKSGSELAVSPGFVGWQAHLSDDNTAQEVYIDRDLGNWGDPSIQRRASMMGGNFTLSGSSSVGAQDSSSATAGIEHRWDRIVGTSGSKDPIVENWYYGGGANLGETRYDFDHIKGMGSAAWVTRAFFSDDDVATNTTLGTDHDGADASSQSVTTTATRKYLGLQSYLTGTTIASDTEVSAFWKNLRTFGTHGLTKQGTAPAEGFYASDVIANAISRWAPLLYFSTGSNGSLTPTSFVIPQLAFREPTTVAEILKEANRFHLRDWAVWEGQYGPTFYYHDRGARGRSWRARIAPSELEETGQSVDRIWNGVIVQFRDVDGTTKTVGPTGSYATTTSTDLIDTDPQNPVNQRGIKRNALLDMGIVSTTAAATEVGRRFLVESKALDTSGKAKIVGHIQDQHGVWHPYWKVRSGDRIRFVDSSDPSPRRIVKTEKDVDARTCSVELDAPPDALAALLERLGVVLVELGLN